MHRQISRPGKPKVPLGTLLFQCLKSRRWLAGEQQYCQKKNPPPRKTHVLDIGHFQVDLCAVPCLWENIPWVPDTPSDGGAQPFSLFYILLCLVQAGIHFLSRSVYNQWSVRDPWIADLAMFCTRACSLICTFLSTSSTSSIHSCLPSSSISVFYIDLVHSE